MASSQLAESNSTADGAAAHALASPSFPRPARPSTCSRQLILASASPRRAQLLRAAGLPFMVAATDFDEPPPSAADAAQPAQYARRLARGKALSCSARTPGALILAADTIVRQGDKILGKPQNAAHAREMLRDLRGQTHQVLTGICLRRIGEENGDELWTEHETTSVTFHAVSDAWIEAYVGSGEPLDKAGAYAAQGRGALLIARIEGDYFNVVGLPLARLGRLLERIAGPLELWWDN